MPQDPGHHKPDPRSALYIHLAKDGAIFVIRGETGEQAWIDRKQLRAELQRASERGGSLLYSREDGDQEPSPGLLKTFQSIVDYKLPIQLLEEPHPQALVAPEQRLTVLNDEDD